MEIEGYKNVNNKLIDEINILKDKIKENESDKEGLILTMNQLKEEIKDKNNELKKKNEKKNMENENNKSKEYNSFDKVSESKYSNMSGTDAEIIEKYKEKYKQQKELITIFKNENEFLKKEIRELKQKIQE